MMEVVLARIRYRRKVSFRCVNKLYHCSVVFFVEMAWFFQNQFCAGEECVREDKCWRIWNSNVSGLLNKYLMEV